MSDYDITVRDERDRLRQYVAILETQQENLEEKIVMLTLQIQDLQRQVNDAIKRMAPKH